MKVFHKILALGAFALTAILATGITPALAQSIDIEEALSQRSVGSPDAPVTVIEFYSMTCPHCAHFHQDVYSRLKEEYVDSGQVQWIVRPFPLDRVALSAHQLARCVPARRFEGFRSLLLERQDTWVRTRNSMEELRRMARLAGVSDSRFEACVNSRELQQGLLQMQQASIDEYDIQATPSFVINGELAGSGMNYEQLSAALDRALQRSGS